MVTFPEGLGRLDDNLTKASSPELENLARLVLAGLSHRKGEMTVDRATRLQTALIDRRKFRLAKEMGEQLRDAGIVSDLLGKLYVQALIDSGQLTRADSEIRRLLANIPETDPQYLELQGLWGRLAKQRYVNDCLIGSAKSEDLSNAIIRYLSAYEANPKRPVWHGINAVALLARAKHDRIAMPAAKRRRSIAKEILARIVNNWTLDTIDFWDCATASEAALALGQYDAAELWLHRYLSDENVPLFAVASTLRQYREVWLLSPKTTPGSVLLPLLDRRLAKAGQIEMSLEDARNGAYGGDFEKVFGKASFMSYAKYRQGAERAKAVARIEDKQGDPQGTGFLMRGSDLAPCFAGHPLVLLTNAHVISALDPEAALHPGDARCAFYGMDVSQGGGATKVAVKDILWSSPSDEFDTTIVSLDGEIDGVEPCALARALPKPGPDSKAFVIGYPNGGGLVFSLFGNEILAYEEKGPKIHYRTPTEPGSSGSPVFNQNWELIAIHHSGSGNMNRIDGAGDYEANEGIKLIALMEAINR